MQPTRFTDTVILAGGGVLDPPSLTLARQAAGPAAAIVAADGGADRLAALGTSPGRIIGDLDSLADPERWRRAGVAVEPIAEQDTTDFEKCLYRTEAPLYLALGFTGGRLDHTLAVLNTLMRRAEKRVIVVAEDALIFHLPPGRRLSLMLEAGATVSIFPLAAVRAAPSRGLEWPLDGLTFRPGGLIGTSNRATGGPVELGFLDPGALVFLPHGALQAVAAALTAAQRA